MANFQKKMFPLRPIPRYSPYNITSSDVPLAALLPPYSTAIYELQQYQNLLSQPKESNLNSSIKVSPGSAFKAVSAIKNEDNTQMPITTTRSMDPSADSGNVIKPLLISPYYKSLLFPSLGTDNIKKSAFSDYESKARPQTQLSNGILFKSANSYYKSETELQTPSHDIEGLSKKRRCRTIFTPEQVRKLQSDFNQSPYISTKHRRKLSEETGLPTETIRVWFQNQRCKIKKRMNNTKQHDSESKSN